MGSTIYKRSLLLAFIMAYFCTPVFAQNSIFDQLRSTFEAGKVFKADFTHTYIDSYTEEETKTNGTIWINKDGYRLEADDQIIVVDGALSTVYDAARNRVIISEYDAEEDDFAPSRLLSGLDETYVLAGEESSGGITTINLESNDDFAVFVGISIEVGSDLHPQKITATDFAENVIITGFSNGEFLSDAEGIFELSPPEDAEIVDMRY
tara:strand:+ start:115525 stop:116148 length:624 start_codon:yes stop_codon:yes gene_type:complete